MLSREETLFPNFYDNIRRSLIPLMHEDMSSILRAYTEEAIARSRKIPWKERNHSSDSNTIVNSDPKVVRDQITASLADVTDDELLLELAKRKAANQRIIAAKSAQSDKQIERGISDADGLVCTFNGGNGSVPCYELME
jgi:hypothetical protein